RDESIIVAQNLLNEEKNALFINLDIKDYFHSCRIDLENYFPVESDPTNVNQILKKIHEIYHKKLSTILKSHSEPSKELLDKSLLPIGLLSSYVIANHYLNDFDKIIINKYKPAYYGRYVDDILLVLSEPNVEQFDNGIYEKYSFDFNKYKKEIHANSDGKITDIKLSKVERHILQTLHPLFKVIPISEKENIIKIDKYDNLI